ncbi:hypothetical protein F180042I2_42170 [Enterocloster bolteae]
MEENGNLAIDIQDGQRKIKSNLTIVHALVYKVNRTIYFWAGHPSAGSTIRTKLQSVPTAVPHDIYMCLGVRKLWHGKDKGIFNGTDKRE